MRKMRALGDERRDPTTRKARDEMLDLAIEQRRVKRSEPRVLVEPFGLDPRQRSCPGTACNKRRDAMQDRAIDHNGRIVRGVDVPSVDSGRGGKDRGLKPQAGRHRNQA